jgi:hypothetical protein
VRGLYRNRSACNKGDNYSDSTVWEAGILRQKRAPSQKGQTNLPIGDYIPIGTQLDAGRTCAAQVVNWPKVNGLR